MTKSLKSSREIALDILIKISKDNFNSKKSINYLLSKHPLSQVDKRLVTDLVYGVLRDQKKLDRIIEYYTDFSPQKIQGNAHRILQIAIYQILHKNRIPEYAVVHQAVEILKKSMLKIIEDLSLFILTRITQKVFLSHI